MQVYLTLSSGSGSLSLSSAFLFTPLLSALSLVPADDWPERQKPMVKKTKEMEHSTLKGTFNIENENSIKLYLNDSFSVNNGN